MTIGIHISRIITGSLIASLCCMIVFSTGSCKKDSGSTTTPQGHQIKSLKTNGTLYPVSHTIATGYIFAVDELNRPIKDLTVSNVTALLKWSVKKETGSDTATTTGTVVLNSITQQGLHIAAAITMDYSPSMGTFVTTIPNMEYGVKTFIKAMLPNDMGEIIKFDQNVQVTQSFTTDTVALNQGVNYYFNQSQGTALYQSIYQGLQDATGLDSSKMMRSVIAFTDGGENSSWISEPEMIAYAQEHRMPIHTIGFMTDNSTDTTDLRYIADMTGGFFFFASNDSIFKNIYATISNQLANAYVLQITWQGNLPLSGTMVYATIKTTYQGFSSSFTRSYTIP